MEGHDRAARPLVEEPGVRGPLRPSGGSPTYLGESWDNLLHYYGEATDASVRQRSLKTLLAYWRDPPVPAGEKEQVKEMLRLWLTRRDQSSVLIQALGPQQGQRARTQ